MDDLAREQRSSRWLIRIAIAAVIVLLAAVIPSPYSIERPGPVVDTLGSVEIKGKEAPVVKIDDAKTYPTSGKLNLLTVSIMGTPDKPASWLSLVPALLDPSQRIAPRDEFFPRGVTTEDRTKMNAVEMDSSQTAAAAAAFHELKEPVGTQFLVSQLASDGPAAGKLEEGDELRTVNGQRIADFEAFQKTVAATPADTALSIGIVRDGAARTVEITPTRVAGAETPMIGIAVALKIELPEDVHFSLENIGGPSAGLTFALAIYDKLTPGEMLEGKTVSGTGTMSPTGKVGAIGGLEQKMWAASRAGTDLFLMPVGNCADVPSSIPGGMEVVPVDTLGEAIAAIDQKNSGGTPRGLERCSG
ncbi:PDZ domain-containing protein [Leucobacter sp. CSA2]|uniref:endopeptidase La n=2 Tax=Leucobacter edaphi TaxID=2796472 RepID=A0A934UWX9_9MICO|nr:S16 family serine protease [Leucobacter edaphi]MBK0421011.1 PDZ domain-containing protein [Leucobacter edaphi]